ncbi:MAG TPA: retropepsin-like aspartic protease, partial [Pyrinomonadaceae bacterium]
MMLKPRAALAAAAVFVALCAPCAAAPADDEAGEVPFTFEKGYVVVAGRIKGKEPAEFILSTGYEHSTADPLQAQKYELQGFYTGVGPITGRNDRTVSFTRVPGVRVGPADASLDMFYASTAAAGRALGREIFGVLGSDFFKGRTVQFDFGKRVLRFLDKASAAALREKAAGAPGAAVLRMGEREDIFGRPLTLPLVEKVVFDGRPGKVMFDTGVVTVVALSASAAKRLGYEPPPEKGAARDDTVRALDVGPVKLSGVPVIIYPKGSPAEARLGDDGALAGSVFLQNFVATFDYRGKV